MLTTSRHNKKHCLANPIRKPLDRRETSFWISNAQWCGHMAVPETCS